MIFILFFISCEHVSSPKDAQVQSETEVHHTRLLSTLTTQVYLPAINEFNATIDPLIQGIDQWTERLDEMSLLQAQVAWRTTMNAWQIVEMMQLGPLGAIGVRVGGEDYRDQVYSFPVTNSCRVDQELVEGTFHEEGWAQLAAFNLRGLDALEYLLFVQSQENTCPQQAKINREGDWSRFTSDPLTLTHERGAYAQVIAQDIQRCARELSERWSGEFGVAFQEGTSPFAHKREVIDQIFAGIFYVDQFAKDLKLGIPLGIHSGCQKQICPEALENPFSQSGKEALIANLEGLIWILTGARAGDESAREVAFGFDDLLIMEGEDHLGAQLISQTQNIIKLLREIDDSLPDQLEVDVEPLLVVHEQIKILTDLLRGQFVTVLHLSIPQEGAGDND